MSYVTIKKLLNTARREHYAVGSFNVWDIQSVKTVIETAEAEKSPVILSVWKEEIDMSGRDNLFAVCHNEIARASVPIALFLDHATSLSELMAAVEAGATSVMFDGSGYPLAENISLTREVVDLVRPQGVAVEGELGVLGEEAGGPVPEQLYTNPGDAMRFVRETEVDCLAVAIGNAHGFYKQEPKLDFERLEKIADITGLPIVLHGGTGIPDRDIRQAINLGVAKVNVGAEGRKAFFDGIKEVFSQFPDQIFPSAIYKGACKKHRKILVDKMRLLGSAQKDAARDNKIEENILV